MTESSSGGDRSGCTVERVSAPDDQLSIQNSFVGILRGWSCEKRRGWGSAKENISVVPVMWTSAIDSPVS